MSLYAWIDENGNWRVSHFKPENERVLLITLPPDTSVVFIDYDEGKEVPVEVRP